MQKKKKLNVRLSKDVVPVEYKIQLKPDLENFTFEGVETITLNVLKSTKVLTLHSKEIEIETAEVKIGSDKIFAKISYDSKNETATFTFPKTIPAGKIKLTLIFRGILNDKMRGFYRSRYTLNEKEFHMATTQFEATDARRAFPCFDEPAHKAIFHVSLIVPKGKTAISNTLPVTVKEHEAGFEIIKFSPTPKMSTYLLAFIVGDFEYLEKKSNRGVLVRIYTLPGKKHMGKFALDVTVRTIEFYEKYFDIPYPLKTLDMIAIPDFSSLAMENWGAVTFRDIGLLVDDENTSARNKEMVAHVIAHELAHQWFGNLVTMEWWTHLWLNEGFASYISYLAADKLFPQWDMWTQFSTNDLGVALRLDSLVNTHPIEVEVHHPNEIGEIFDEVSYSKGASVIRMLADYLGEKDFRDGLRYYLKKHSYKNTETIHLWQAFEKVSRKPITKMMHNWTSKPGYPIVKAEMRKNELRLSQERFFASPHTFRKLKGVGASPTIWQIPVITSSQKFILSRREQKVLVPSKNFLKMNLGEAGFFRTAYSKELLEKLHGTIANIPTKSRGSSTRSVGKKLSARDRLGVIRDLFALSEAGVIPTTDALEFLSAYKTETNYSVWLELAMGLARIEQLLALRSLGVVGLNKFIIDLFTPTFKRLSWNKKPKDSHTDSLLRSLAISRLGRAGDMKIIAEAKKKFKSGKIHADLRGAVYAVVATHGGKKEFDQFIKKYKTESLHEEKNRLGSALGDFTDPKLLRLAAEFAMSKHVRKQDTVSILSTIGANAHGREVWWNFIQKNWKTLVSRYGEGGLTLGRSLKCIGGSAEEKHLKSFKKFFATHEAPGAKRVIAQVLERLEANVAWYKRDAINIKKFLKK